MFYRDPYEFHWISMGFNGFQWVSMGFTRFFLGCTKFYLVFKLVLQGSIRVPLGVNGFQWVSMGFNGFQWVSMGCFNEL